MAIMTVLDGESYPDYPVTLMYNLTRLFGAKLYTLVILQVV